MTKTAQIGSLSWGTMRNQDLIPVFLDELRDLGGNEIAHNLLTACDIKKGTLLSAMDDDGHAFWGSESNHYLMEYLFDALNEYAPEYCYFGAHDGDGSDYGFWPSLDGMDDDGDVLMCGDGRDETPIPEYILHVNDHGNTTLYRIKLETVWEIV